MKKPNNSFVNWIENRLDDKSRNQLFHDLLGFMPLERDVLIDQLTDSMANDEKGDLVNKLADELNDASYDWGVFREGDEIR